MPLFSFGLKQILIKAHFTISNPLDNKIFRKDFNVLRKLNSSIVIDRKMSGLIEKY